MALRFFLDHCVPNSVKARLETEGHLALLLREHLPTDAPDVVVIAKAQELDAILVSLNGDFADLVSYPPTRFKGIIAMQVRNHPEVLPHVLARLNEYFATHPQAAHYEGKLLIAEPHQIRIRGGRDA